MRRPGGEDTYVYDSLLLLLHSFTHSPPLQPIYVRPHVRVHVYTYTKNAYLDSAAYSNDQGALSLSPLNSLTQKKNMALPLLALGQGNKEAAEEIGCAFPFPA